MHVAVDAVVAQPTCNPQGLATPRDPQKASCNRCKCCGVCPLGLPPGGLSTAPEQPRGSPRGSPRGVRRAAGATGPPPGLRKARLASSSGAGRPNLAMWPPWQAPAPPAQKWPLEVNTLSINLVTSGSRNFDDAWQGRPQGHEQRPVAARAAPGSAHMCPGRCVHPLVGRAIFSLGMERDVDNYGLQCMADGGRVRHPQGRQDLSCDQG